jgi:acetyl-CoA C-acetyltransferase
MANSSPSERIVIAGAARTALGRFQGELSPVTATALGTAAIRAALSRAGVAADKIDEVLMGCVLPAGLGQNPARQAARGAALPDATGATTVNKVCGSGMKATMLGHDLIRAGSADIVVTGGMESMSNAPYLLDKARGGYRVGHGRVIDHMMRDGLEDAYETDRAMGTFGEATAERYQFTRAMQDAYAIETLKRAKRAVESGAFAAEIVPVTVPGKTAIEVKNDELPLKLSPEKIPTLKAAFQSRRHGDRRELERQCRWRRGAGADAPFARRTDEAAGAGRNRRPRHALASARVVHDRPRTGDPQAAEQDRLDGQRR